MSETAATDLQLLTRYTRDHVEDAFAELVRRHVDLVHSAALRQVRSPQLAEEVAQSAFTDLARNAHRLAPDTIVTAWLYQVTRRTAIDVVRREARRQLREQLATEMNAMNASGTGFQPVWSDIEQHLDEAMSALDETDRAAVLLRYFENKSLREVGATLGTSDDAAQKRVSRAVERLREFFAKHGVSVGAGGLAVAISANAVQAAPIGLAVTISTTAAAMVGTAIASTATLTATNAIVMTTLQKTLVTATVAVLAGVGIYEARQVSHLRSQVQALNQKQAAHLAQIEKDQSQAAAQFAALRDDNARFKSNAVELLRLRAEVTRLKASALETARQEASTSPQSGSAPDKEKTAIDVPKDSWGDVGFATPQSALQTRGWAILNGNRERFNESIVITDVARQQMEAMLEKMIAAAPAADRQKFSQQILENSLGFAEALLFPMMAENQAKNYTGYKILSQQAPSPDVMILEVATQMASGPAKNEMLKFQLVGNDWKAVIDEAFIKAQQISK